MSYAPLAEVVRSGFVESVHAGAAVAVDPGGEIIVSAGTPDRVILPRSASKPLQAVAMLRAGLRASGPLLALAASSHSGERYHRDGVERMLEAAGLTVAALQNTPDLPLDDEEREVWRRSGRGPASLAQNCSGKHAAMLITCLENGWSPTDYRSPDHPLQVHIAETVAELAGEQVVVTAVDGCGAPVLGLSPLGLARAFSRLATAAAGTPEALVADAVRLHPEWLGGTGRPVTRLLRAVPGLVAKDGAEAVYAAALPDGRALAVKIADGAQRAVLPAVVALLRRLGVDGGELQALADVPVLGHGQPVGRVRVVAF